MVEGAVTAIANQMANAVNPIRRLISKIEGTSYTELSPENVFLEFFNGPITLNKTTDNCTVALDCVAWVNDGETTVNLRIISNPYLIVHEIFHVFDLTILDGDANQALLNAQDVDDNFPDRPGLDGPSDLRWGFAGSNFSDWQKSRSGLSGEEFADMGIGWTYNRWDSDIDGLTEAGLYRANFMNVNMGLWVYSQISQ
ncbi:MAG: hypothetical protein KDE51_05855 [Anaerolineales bacterium]|nr:hypothetical protein [Anaerolineales bacterium]